MRPASIVAVALALTAFLVPVAPVSAGSPGRVGTITTTNTGGINFSVSDLTNSRLPGSQSYTFSVRFTTSTTPGTISITAPAITGTNGNSIPSGAFWAQCTVTSASDPNGYFTSSGIVQLAATPITCGSLTPSSTETLGFTVTLYLDDTPGPSAFTADTYTSAALTVTVNCP